MPTIHTSGHANPLEYLEYVRIHYIVKILNLYIILSCTHLSLLSSIYPLPAMHSLLVTLYVTEYLISINQRLSKWQPCHIQMQLKLRPVKLVKQFVSSKCKSLLSVIYPFHAMHSLLGTIVSSRLNHFLPLSIHSMQYIHCLLHQKVQGIFNRH